MRRIHLQQPSTKEWQRWLRDCQKETKILQDAIDLGEPVVFKDLYKRRKEFWFDNDSPFYGKCAYCECYITGFQHGDIEHFRPKGGVTDEFDRVIPHPGYYWLAYDWRNLLPSCIACNQATSVNNKKIGKHNRFPVIGIHAQNQSEIANEQPLLINPASENDDDDPGKHLGIDLTTGLMIPLTERGKMCIEIFGLNVRDRLLEERRTACREVNALWSAWAYNIADRPETAKKFKEIRQEKCSYSLTQNTMLADLLNLGSEISND
jgi:uncharacterized protein (TIGR02646 family)